MATHSSLLETPMDGGTWWVTVHVGHKELDTTEATQQQGIRAHLQHFSR